MAISHTSNEMYVLSQEASLHGGTDTTYELQLSPTISRETYTAMDTLRNSQNSVQGS